MVEIGDGIGWLLGHRLLRVLTVMLGIGNLTFSAILSIFVRFAQDMLGLDSVGYGVLLASGGVGAVLGSLLAGSAPAGRSFW